MINLNPPVAAVQKRHRNGNLSGQPLDLHVRIDGRAGACGFSQPGNDLIVSSSELGLYAVRDGHVLLPLVEANDQTMRAGSESRTKWERFALALFLCLSPTAATAVTEDETYTLYRNSIAADMRIHIATFDTEEGAAYNQENCMIAADLFERQPGVSVRYWCERGGYRK